MNQVRHSQGDPQWVTTRDGRRLHAQVLDGPRGEHGAPTVVFEAGAGTTRSYWAVVQQRVTAVARAVVYDRAGLGRSAPDPVGRTLDRMADDLTDLLDHFAPGPFILVGHSAGGPIVRLAAARRQSLVAGLVLVDPTDEAADVLFSRGFRRNERIANRVGAVLARLGVLRFLYRSLLNAAPAADVRADLLNEAFTPAVIETMSRQGQTFLDELERWRTAPPETCDIPVTMISGGLARAGDGMPKSVRAQAISAHAFRAAQVPHGRHVIARHSGHAVPLTEPDVIADEIIRLVTEVRSPRDG